jgi:hypothetical protein
MQMPYSTRQSLSSVQLAATLFCGASLCLSPRNGEADPQGTYGFFTNHGPPGDFGGLLGVQLATGTRQTLSDFNDPAKGPVGFALQMTAGLSPNELLVGAEYKPDGDTAMRGALFSVNLLTGKRAIVRDFGGFSNDGTSYAYSPWGLTRDLSGRILVIVSTDLPRLYRLDPTTDTLTVLSDLGNASQGPVGGTPRAIAQHPSGAILVVKDGIGNGALLRVDPVSGSRSVLSDFGNPSQGPKGLSPVDVVVSPLGEVLVGTYGPPGAVFRVDILTGARVLVSDLSNPSQGPLGCHARAVAIAAGGVLVLDDGCVSGNPHPALFKVDPATGNRVLLSDLKQNSQGPEAAHPWDVTFYSCRFCPVVYQELPHLRIITGECSVCSRDSLPPLLREIDEAIEFVKATQLQPAVNSLQKFVRLTEQFVRKREIPEAIGRELTAQAQAVISELRAARAELRAST